jgi:hypothetical protein
MKKVKLMLLSLSVLAVVAGALAFTAKGNLKFCTAAIEGSSPFCNKACPTYVTTLTTVAPNTFICTAPTSNNSDFPCKVGGNPLNGDISCGTNSSHVRFE